MFLKNQLALCKHTLIAGLAVLTMGTAYADQFEFKDTYNNLDLILDTTSFDAVKNGWTITSVEANASNWTLMATGPVPQRTNNANFIFNTANGLSISGSTGTLNLNENPGPTQNTWEFDQRFPSSVSFLVGPAGGIHADTFSVAAVPEPETYAMLLAGLGLIGSIVKRRKQNKA